MKSRFVTLKVILITFMAIALVAIPTLTQADVSKIVQKVTGDTNDTSSSMKKNNEEASKVKQPYLFQRTTYAWPFASGPYYGDVQADLSDSPYTLRTLVGSFDIRSGVFNIPAELRKGVSLAAQNAVQYFIVQFRPGAFDNGKFEKSTRAEFESMGVQFYNYVPNRAYIALLNAGNYQTVASSSQVQFVEPYHPAFKIAPNVGQNPLPDPVAAVSPIYTLQIVVFPNEPTVAIAQMISMMGGMVRFVYGDTIYASIDRSKIGAIAGIEAVKVISEEVPMFLKGEETTCTMQTGEYNNGSLPYFDAGIDGGSDGTADYQYVAVIDTGASYDAGDLSNTSSDPGYPADPTLPNATHRKIYLYKSTSSFGGAGDLLSSDGPTTCNYSHGHVVAATALGNASDVPAGYGAPWFFYDENSNPWKIDGVAKGAKLLFYDGYTSPAGSCDETISPGTLYSAGVGVLADGYMNKARLFNLSWGSTTDKTYIGHAVQIDNFLFDKKDGMVFIAAGNEGTDTNNDSIPDPGTAYNPTNAKNAIAVGACWNARGWDQTEYRVSTSSCGPVGSTAKPRVAPLLMAPGYDDTGGLGIASEFNCRSQDNDQVGSVVCTQVLGSVGTSFSAPAAAGSGAIVRDYFAKGFYPDGTASNTNNDADRIPAVSGALVKAVLVASADWMHGYAKYRFNNEQGYGRIQLNHVLPLVTDPSTPLGLIIDDQGRDSGVGIAPGQTVTMNFSVTDGTQELRAALAWVETSGEDLVNNLDLELLFDSDTDGTVDAGEPRYWGNYFTEDANHDDTLATEEDNDSDGQLDHREFSLRIVDPSKAARESYNPVEAIFISPDENNDGTIDIPTGTWTLKITASASNPETQKYAVAITGGVVLGSSIRFDKNPLSCADIVHVVVNEKEDAGDPVDATVIKSRTTIYVKTVGPDGQMDTGDDITYDTETGITFKQDGTGLKFRSADLPTSDSGTQADNNGILDIQNGYFLKAVYADSTATRFSIATTDCTIRFGTGVKFTQWGRDYAYFMDGGCEINGLGRSFPDKHFDPGEKIVYWVSFLNAAWIQLFDLEVSLRAVNPDGDNDTDPGRLNNAESAYVHIMNSPKVVGYLPWLSAMSIPFDVYVDGNPPFPTKIEMVMGVRAHKSGKTVYSYVAYEHLVNADDERFHYSTDYPTGMAGAKVYYDFNNDEKVNEAGEYKGQGGQLDDPGEDWDLWYEWVKFDDMTTTAFGGGNPSFNGPWDFNTDKENFRVGVHTESTAGASAIANWGEDKDYDDTLDTGEDRDPTGDGLTYAWGIGGGCGFQTNASGQTTQGGAWHTGNIFRYNTKIACMIPQKAGDPINCQPYEVRTGETGQNYWFDFLRTPVINKVHVNPDANGFEYYVEFHNRAFNWNQQMELLDNLTLFAYEVDTDVESDTGINLGDLYVLNLFPGPMGLKVGGNQALTDGFTVFAPSDAQGNQTNGTLGNNRVGKRGCYFQGLNSTQRSYPHGLALPPDDDIDQDSPADGTDEYVSANGPIRNMDIIKNNGLFDYETLEDYFGDAGKKFQAAFAFYTQEGTPGNQPLSGGYGMGVDDVELRWDEIHPVADTTDCSVNGQCASISIKTINMFEGMTLVPVTVLDGNASTQANLPSFDKTNPTAVDYQDSDSDGLYEVKVFAYSEAERDGEYFWLEQKTAGGFEYAGDIPVSAGFNAPGIIFIKRDGIEVPSIYIRYVDKNDGVSAHTYSLGADGQPGAAGVDDDKYGPDGQPGSADYDDDGDGTIDEANEWCPSGKKTGDDDCSNLVDEADEHCPVGSGFILRPYGDDKCGCPTNPLEYGSAIHFEGGRMAVSYVYQVSDNGDNDGFADPGELVTLDITIRNLVTSIWAGGAFIPLTGVVGRLSSTDPDVACVLDANAAYGNMAPLEAKTNPTSDRFQFQIKSTTSRTTVWENIDAEFLFTISSNEISGTYNPIKIVIPLDLNASGGSGSSQWTENFVGDSHQFEFGRFAAADGQRCQYNDPTNPNSNSYGRANCNIDAAGLDQDWHIHDTSSPDSGRAYDGTKSMHWGFHSNATNPAYDTEHLQEMNFAATNGKINLGLTQPYLHFKHQISIVDYRNCNANSGTSADRAIVMVARTDSAGTVQGNWIKVYPYQNVYVTQATDQYQNCMMDPTDDGSTEDDFFPNDYRHGSSSTCYPEFNFTHLGFTDYRQTADKFDPNAVGDGDGPGLKGSLGPGTWVESFFNLERFKGYMVKIRFLVTTIEASPSQTYLDLGWDPEDYYDDGWYIDQIVVENTLTTPYTMTVDNNAPPANNCPIDPVQNCDVVTASATCSNDWKDNDQDGTIDESAEDNCHMPAPGHFVVLNAGDSTADKCVNGTLQYEWWLDANADGTLNEGSDTKMYDWCDKNYYIDAPTANACYFVKVRCSSDTDCAGTTILCVTVGPQMQAPGGVSGLAFLSNNKSTFGWTAAVQATNYDTVKGDLRLLRTTLGDFNTTVTSCLEDNGTDTQSTDAPEPAPAGEGFYYLVRAINVSLSGTYNNVGDAKQIGDRDAEIALDPDRCP